MDFSIKILEYQLHSSLRILTIRIKDIIISIKGGDELKKSITCCFTGYRPNNLPYKLDESHPLCEELKCVFADEINNAVQEGYTHYIIGMALGVETWFAEVVLFMKKIHPAITLECVHPQGNRTKYRNENKRFLEIMNRCDKITVLENVNSNRSTYEYGQYMIDHASLLISVYNGLPCVCGILVNYARMHKLNIILIDPSNPKKILRETTKAANDFI